MIRKILFALTLLALLVTAACTPASTAEKTLVVAVAGALTGPSAQDGNDIKRGAELAVDHINSQGGINGAKIELIFEDDRSDPKEAANVANKLVNDQRVLAVIGHYNSSCTLAGAPIYNKAGLVEISAGSTSPAVSDAGPYTFRTIVTDAFQGDFVARWMVQDDGHKRVAILFENDDYGVGLKNVIATKVAEYGGEIVGEESFYLGETKDFTPLITKIRGLNPDALFIAGLYNEGALIAKQAAEVGWTPPLYGVDGLYSAPYIELGGSAVEGTKVVGFFHTGSTDPFVQKFVQDFKAKFNVLPGTYAAYGYDAMISIAEAMKKGGPDRTKIKDYLTTLKDLKGVTGVISFDENGDRLSTPLKLIVKNGEFAIMEQ